MLRWALAASVAALMLPAAASAAVQPFGKLDCVAQEGVRFCPGDGGAKRVAANPASPVPLDVDVALPATGDANLPVVFILHGFGGKKGGFGEMKSWAQRGYAVVDYSARGFGDSCGSTASRLSDPVGCAQGWVRLADTRYEVRDSQELAGLLADQGIIDPQRIGVTGTSYGGGQSMALATLRDRVMNADGSLKPWTSPGGRPMRIAGAAPIIPWSDLVYSLVPNGRTLDYTLQPTSGTGSSREPIGVEKQTFVSGLFANGLIGAGYYAPPGADSQADLTTWLAVISAGEPYDSNPQAKGIVDEIATHHSSYQLPFDRAPAPLLISNGWTDDLFPADEALRYYNRTRATFPSSPIALRFFDFGHMRGQNKAADTARMRAAIDAWFDRYVKGGGPTPASDVTVLTQTCPAAAASAGPFTAPTWDAIHPGEVSQRFAAAKTYTSAGGDPSVNQKVDPVAGGGACAATPSGDLNGVATYRFAPSPGYTLLGAPRVTGRFDVTGPNGQIAARLWDVAPDGGQQTLVGRGLYRLNASATVTFQLHANAWRFAPGHVAKLELLGNDTPYGRSSNGAFSVSVSNLSLALPVIDQPGAFNGLVQSPGILPVPPGQRLATGVVRLRLGLRYTRPFVRVRSRGRSRRARARCWSTVQATVGGQGAREIRRVEFFLGTRRIAVDSRRPFSVPIRRSATIRSRSRRLAVRAILRSGRRVPNKTTLRFCR